MSINQDPRLVAFERLLNIMDDLREKCPWDRKQTLESLRMLTIEETYELSEAILESDKKGIEEELGDLLLHMVFYCKIGSETGDFTVDSTLNRVCEKLISRHPHIYGDIEVADEEEVKQNWEKLKLKEGKKSVLSGVPHGLPPILKAYRIQDKVKQVGFEWENIDQVWDKVKEEEEELLEAVDEKNKEKISEEFGDLVFSLINYSRFLQIDPEEALERTNQKFIKRFNYIESEAKERGLDLEKMTLEEMDALWVSSKSLES